MRQLLNPFQHTQTLVINEVREQIQEDLRAIFSDSLPDKAMDDVCQMVVDKFKRLKDES